jgi:hypothetical protein
MAEGHLACDKLLYARAVTVNRRIGHIAPHALRWGFQGPTSNNVDCGLQRRAVIECPAGCGGLGPVYPAVLQSQQEEGGALSHTPLVLEPLPLHFPRRFLPPSIQAKEDISRQRHRAPLCGSPIEMN